MSDSINAGYSITFPYTIMRYAVVGAADAETLVNEQLKHTFDELSIRYHCQIGYAMKQCEMQEEKRFCQMLFIVSITGPIAQVRACKGDMFCTNIRQVHFIMNPEPMFCLCMPKYHIQPSGPNERQCSCKAWRVDA